MASIQLFLIIIFIIFLVDVPFSCGDAQYTACSIRYSCGAILDVGYPFWGDNRPKFCGIPGFRLQCRNDQAVADVLNNGYFPAPLLKIDADSHTMVVDTSTAVTLIEQCSAENSTLVSQLKPEAGYEELSLFYGCSNCDDHSRYQQSKSLTCTNSNGTKGTAYYFGNQSDISQIGGNKSCSCNSNLTFPVDKRVLDELRGSNASASLKSILSKWQSTKVKYIADFAACSKCEKSGGRCGSPDDRLSSSVQFLCYCPDGPQPLTCAAGTYLSGWRRNLKFIVSGIAALLLGMVMLVALVFRNTKMRSYTNRPSFPWSKKYLGDQNVETFIKNYAHLVPKRYTYANLTKMTNSFKEKLGEGGYGSVYKGKLCDGRLVAVKKMKNLKGDGKDFINEVLSISRANHVNVVTLLGFCVEGSKRALVFEFLPNGSLEKFMYGKKISQPLNWDTMLNIAIGIAKGLDYLHRGCTTRILHFDIKPHNILLDEHFHPKISDFGLARLCSPKNSMISMSDARGTIGYIAPEVFCRNFGGVSHKSDVYSFGMMLLDLVCGRNNLASNAECSSEIYFPEWIYNQLEQIDDDAEVTIQETTENGKDKKLKRKMILVSLWCIQVYPSNRPPINRVVEMLEGSLESLQIPPKSQWSSSSVPYVSDSAPMLQSLESKDEKLTMNTHELCQGEIANIDHMALGFDGDK